MSREEIEEAHAFLKRSISRSIKQFTSRGLEPPTLRMLNDKIRDLPPGLSGINRKQAEVAAWRKFYFTTPPGRLSETRADTSTVSGYKAYLKDVGKNLGIKNYHTSDWSEQQRRDLWEIIDKVREIGPDKFLPNGYGSEIYQSGRTFKTVTILVNELGYTDPTIILETLQSRIDAVENGNDMTDEQFFGLS